LNLIEIVAQTTAPATQASAKTEPPWYAGPLMPLILLAIVMYFFMFRSRGKEKGKRQDMLSKMKKGDEVQTIGGEYGRIVDLKEDRVLLKVDETSNTKIWYGRSAIHRVVTDDAKAEAK
jgi:preprotein translocase subunit YajC